MKQKVCNLAYGNLEPIFCMQDWHYWIALVVEYRGQTKSNRNLDCKPFIETYY